MSVLPLSSVGGSNLPTGDVCFSSSIDLVGVSDPIVFAMSHGSTTLSLLSTSVALSAEASGLKMGFPQGSSLSCFTSVALPFTLVASALVATTT